MFPEPMWGVQKHGDGAAPDERRRPAGVFSVVVVAVVSVILGYSLRAPLSKSGVDPCGDAAVDEVQGSPHNATGLVLVTGASGFIGSHLTAQLLELGYTVRVFDNLETGNILFLDLSHPRLQFVFGDILDMAAVRRAMVGVSGVFHLAAASKVLPSLKSPRMATFNIERNAVGSAHVLEAANETGLVRKVVYAASSTYYGNQAVPFVETDPFVTTSPYAASKYMGELQMQTNDQLYGLPTLSLRYFMVYGPRNPSEGAYAVVTGKFLKRLQASLPLVIEGSGENFRDFVHVEDVARANILALQSAVHGMVINIGSGGKHSVKELADLVSRNQEHVAPRKNDLLGTLADTCRAKRLLHFRGRRDFISTMREMIRDSLAGKDSYIPSVWKRPDVIAALEQQLLGWSAANFRDQGTMIADRIRADSSFLSTVQAAVKTR